MACRDHEGGVFLGEPVRHGGCAIVDVNHVASLVGDAVDKGFFEGKGARAVVSSDDDLFCFEKKDCGSACVVCEFFVYFERVCSSDVVGEFTHDCGLVRQSARRCRP